mmetsp:Transcript_33449/g.65911  ORF Transcript_33449/g.65911 Transcript_33449/m.65911 type:complete len:98 (+) Transcript_33449:26-319(+)
MMQSRLKGIQAIFQRCCSACCYVRVHHKETILMGPSLHQRLHVTLAIVFFSCFLVLTTASSFLRAGQVTENDAEQAQGDSGNFSEMLFSLLLRASPP